jgi:hypothetical protein
VRNGNHSKRAAPSPLAAVGLVAWVFAIYLLGHYGWALFVSHH